MFIRTVDDGLEKLLREELPLPPSVGEISFEAPTGSWSAQLSRLTVNVFLYDVRRSTQPPRSPIRRVTEDGTVQRRAPLPMVQLSYLVSAWAGSPRDEHQLLGDVINRLSALTSLHERYLPVPAASSIDLSLVEDPDNRLRDIWGAVGGQLRASCSLQLTVAADAFDWSAEAPAVQRIEALTAPIPRT